MERPNRSDVHLPMEEEERIEAMTREHFDDLAPKRHSKPQRSDYSSQYTDLCDRSETIPEFTRFQDLENHPQKLVYEGSEVTEEFVETEYYKDLNEIDKEHHTTGTGFIKREKSNGSYISEVPDSSDTGCHISCKANPATNDWIPSTEPCPMPLPNGVRVDDFGLAAFWKIFRPVRFSHHQISLIGARIEVPHLLL